MYWYTTYMLLQSKTAVKKTVCSESRLVSFGASSCEFNNWLFLLFLLVLAMNRAKSKEVYSIQRFVHPPPGADCCWKHFTAEQIVHGQRLLSGIIIK